MGRLRIKVLRRVLDDMEAHHYSEDEIRETVRQRYNKQPKVFPVPEGASMQVTPADHVIFDYQWED